MARKRPVSPVEYTGLVDTTEGFTGSSTLDSSVDPGSPLPLVIGADRNAGINSPHNRFYVSTYDLWDQENPGASLMLSGVSDPPFASDRLSTPYPAARQPYGSMFNAFAGQSKYGSGIATLLGNHPETVTAVPSEIHGGKARVLTHTRVPSGAQTAIITIVVIALGLLLLTGGE